MSITELSPEKGETETAKHRIKGTALLIEGTVSAKAQKFLIPGSS